MKSLFLNGFKLFIHDNVYEPSDDTWLLMNLADEVLSRRESSELCVDLGCGSGVLGLYMLFKNYCRRVFFIDINPYATTNTVINLVENKFMHRGIVVLSEPYVFIEKADVVLANPPYLPEDEYRSIDIYNDISVIGGAEGFETLFKFIDFASEILVENGYLFITYSTLTKPKVVEEYIVSRGFKIIIKRTAKFFYEELIATGAVKK
ncbi:MAG: methyltransferase [Desulfurococcaceae archaeon]